MYGPVYGESPRRLTIDSWVDSSPLGRASRAGSGTSRGTQDGATQKAEVFEVIRTSGMDPAEFGENGVPLVANIGLRLLARFMGSGTPVALSDPDLV